MALAGVGDDTFYGGAGNDSVGGDVGTDTLFGGDGSDTLDGQIGNDSIDGGSGDDQLSGSAGNDSIFGDGGSDIIYGGAGNDTLTGGDGNDTLTGGTGNDMFVLSAGGGGDTITDIVFGGAENDQIDSSALTDVGNALTNQDGTVTADEITVTGGGGADQILTFPSGETVTVPDGTINTTTTQTQFASLIAMGVPPCFAPGTLIWTDRGDVSVERLRPGDRILTADHGPQPLRWIGRREVDFTDPANNRGGRDKPIEIKAGRPGPGACRAGI